MPLAVIPTPFETRGENVTLRELLSALCRAGEDARLGVVITLADRLDNVYLSRASCELLGYSAEELFERPIWSFIAKEEVPRLMAIHERRLRGEPVPTSFEIGAVKKSGEKIHLEVATHRIGFEGRPANVTVFRDISTRKEAEEAASASELRFRTLIESAPDGVVIGSNDQITFMNPAASRIFEGLSSDQIVEALRLPENRTSNKAPIARRVVHADGRVVHVEFTRLQIEFEGRDACLAFVRDVTERNEMQAQLIQGDRLAAMGTLAAGIAHEINNPLAYLMLNVEFIRRELPRVASDPSVLPNALERLREVHEGASRVATIVRDLKRLTRSDEDVFGPVDLAETIDGAIRIAHHQLKHRGRLTRTYDDIPPVTGNAARLEQVFLNLIINATHALLPGNAATNRVSISVYVHSADEIVAEVSDNGIGMEDHVLARMFEPFFTTKPVGEGTGLGLSVCHGIVQSMGGRLEVESQPKRGTSARVYLPAHHQESIAPDEPFRESVGAPSGVPRRPRVLIIDDEENLAFTLSRLLEPNYATHTENSGASAWTLFESGSSFDAVLCDVVMPFMSGIELYRKVQTAHPELAEKFIFCTGGAIDSETEQFLGASGAVTLQKPILLRQVLRAIEATWNRTESVQSA